MDRFKRAIISGAKSTVKSAFAACGIEVRRIKSLAKKKEASYSYCGEQAAIEGYLPKFKKLTRYAIDIAASGGIGKSNTYALYLDGWCGLAVEYDGKKFSELASNYQSFSGVSLCKSMITPENVLDILRAYGVPKDFGFLSLDIDSYDYFVLEKILSAYRPSLICVEINERIPPPIKFTVTLDQDFVGNADNFYGQSLSQVAALAEKTGYSLIELHYNNAFLAPKELNIAAALSPEEAYRQGYVDRPDRKKKFPWNKDFEEVLTLKPAAAMEFFDRYFKKHEGKYTISI